jgi:hypothetical protein
VTLKHKVSYIVSIKFSSNNYILIYDNLKNKI